MQTGRKFYKTKLCKLYQGGRCPRPNCNFAHGNAELRHAPALAPFNGRRDFRNGDLRDKLERRHSPHRRYSPGRDTRGYHGFHGQRPVSNDRGYSDSRSPVKRSERRHRKKQHVDEESDDSESFKRSNAAEDKKDGKVSSYDEKDDREELKKLQLDIDTFEVHKSQLESLLEEKVDEACKLSNGIQDLELQLNKEQEDCKRIMSKIKKFVRAHGRYLKAQEELKRSQARLQRLGDQLGSDNSKPNANEEDSSENFLSDGEPVGDKRRSPRNDELLSNTSFRKKQHAYTAASEEVQIGNSHKRKRFSGLVTRSEKFTRDGHLQSQIDNKESESNKGVHIRKDFRKPMADEYKNEKGKTSSPSHISFEKVKNSEVGHSLPSTGMAAHAVDETIEAVEIEDKTEAEANADDELEVVDNKAALSRMPPPPPPVTQNPYRNYEGDDEDVDVENMDSEMVDIDINSEVEIEQNTEQDGFFRISIAIFIFGTVSHHSLITLLKIAGVWSAGFLVLCILLLQDPFILLA